MSWRPNHWMLRSFFVAMSVRRPSSRYIEHPSGRERAVLRREPADQRRDLVDRHEAAHRDLREHVIDVVLLHLIEYRRLRGGGRDAVYEHPGLGELLAQRLRQGDDSGFRGA